MARIGYARISTREQDLTIQKESLASAGFETVRAETASGSSRQGRVELQAIMAISFGRAMSWWCIASTGLVARPATF